LFILRAVLSRNPNSKGHVVQADTSNYFTTNQKHTSFLTYSWGLVADVDMESECIRWMGTARLDLWAVYRILFLRTYKGRLSYTTDPTTQSVPPITDPAPSDWTVLEDEFVLFWASQVTHASMGFYHSPPTQVGDAAFQIMMIRKPLSRLQMIRILLSIDSGEHIHLKGVEFIKCSAYRLEPVGSFNVIDGELVEAGPIQAHVVPKSMLLFGKPAIAVAAASSANANAASHGLT
jgi:sphingosine kinase